MTSDAGATPAAEEAGPDVAADEVKSKLSPGARLRGNHNFNLFWAGQTFDAFGDAAALIIIPLLVFDATGSVIQMGLVTALIGVGNLISSIISGIFVDSMDRRKVLLLCDIGRTFFYLVLPVYWWLVGASMWPIYVIALITAYLTTFFVIAYVSAIPNIVDQDQIADANGRLQATVALASVAGPMLTGFASKQFGSSKAIIIVAAAYWISACLMFFVRLRKGSPKDAEQASDSGGSRLDSLLVGVRFLLNHPALRTVTFLLAAISFVTGATINLFIYRLRHDLNQSDNTVGVVFGLASLGAVAAGAIAPLLYRKKGFGFSFLGSFFFIGLTTLLAGFAHSLTVIALMAVGYSFGLTIRGVSSMTLRQQVTPNHLLGRVSSAFWALLTVLGPLGTAAASALAEVVGTPAALIVIGTLCMVIAVVGLFTQANIRQPELLYPAAAYEATGKSPAGS
ncbi:MAG TPA: MFS transporter [Blastocatellia bacterium]|jgi:MFS family permease|nr:MFS transporter [Blastocatellia bacterium]